MGWIRLAGERVGCLVQCALFFFDIKQVPRSGSRLPPVSKASPGNVPPSARPPSEKWQKPWNTSTEMTGGNGQKAPSPRHGNVLLAREVSSLWRLSPQTVGFRMHVRG